MYEYHDSLTRLLEQDGAAQAEHQLLAEAEVPLIPAMEGLVIVCYSTILRKNVTA
jgi:hypothetical protein